MFKKWIFPIKRQEWFIFGAMFLIVCLINVNFSILRSMRNALVVADTGGSAAFIPYFELFGTFPASIALTWAISRLMRRFTSRFIFSVTMVFFLAFFVLFAFSIYPNREAIHNFLGLSGEFFTHWPDMIFYIMSELWKVALLSVIFWGFLNRNLSIDEAKRFYPPLLLGSSIGTIISGPITVFCTSAFIWIKFPLSNTQWQHSLYLLTLFLILCGVATLGSFSALFKKLEFRSSDKISEMKKEPFSSQLLSLSSSLRYLIKSPYLSGLLLIVVAEYVSYALGELIFLETLKSKYPNPSDYCKFMGNLSFWMGLITAFSALFLTPYLLGTYRWSRIALITPILMVLVTFSFFFAACFPALFIEPLRIAVLLGSIHFCIGRAAKYTLFDAIKELAFIPLNQEAQVKGKLVIDGIGSRLGRGGSSFLSIGLFLALGGPAESALFVGILALCFALISIQPSYSIGLELEKSSSPAPNLQKA